MDINHILRSILMTLALAAAMAAQSAPKQENPLDRLNRMSDAEAIGFVNSVLVVGLPEASQGDSLYSLIFSRSSVLLPILEERIEELLRSPFPQDLYTNKAASLEEVVLFLSAEIEQAGNRQALLEAGKLLKVDEQRFDHMVERTWIFAYNKRNPFTVAYQGFEIGDPAVDKRIVVWAEKELAKVSNSSEEGMKHRWADAIVEKYGGVPAEEEWAKDPILSRLKPGLAKSLHGDVFRLSVEASKKRAK